MELTNEEKIYLLKKYIAVRFANRGWLFEKKENIIDPRTIPDVLDYFEVGNIQGFFLEKDEKKYVIFIGSNEPLDWIYNFLFRLKRVPYKKEGTNRKIKVHAGFYKSYLKVRDFVLDKVKTDENIVVFGQSFGAAVATLAALDIQYNFPKKNIICMTTGSPRVGNESFVNSYNKRVPETKRYVCGKDVVTSVPPKWLWYEHVSVQRYLKPREGKLHLIKNHLIESYLLAFLEEELKVPVFRAMFS